MPLAKCVRCETLFNKSAAPVCGSCLPAEEADHETVRNYLADHPNSSAEMVGEATGVDLKCVLRMVDEGLVTNTTSVGMAKCGRCGAPAISLTKKLCTTCLEDLNRQIAKQRSRAQIESPKKVQVGQYVGVRQTLDSKQG